MNMAPQPAARRQGRMVWPRGRADLRIAAMDPITHMLAGAAVAQLGFRQRIGRQATWAAVAATVTPDLDVFLGPLAARFAAAGDNHFTEHRGLSHSLLAVPVLAAVIGGAWWLIRRRVLRRGGADGPPSAPAPFWLLYACLFLTLLTHSLIDGCTSYGTQLLAPLTDTRYAFDLVPILDLFFTGILAATVLACFAVRRLAPRGEPQGSLMLGRAGFLLALAYLAGGLALHNEAITQGRAFTGEAPIVRADAYPALGSIFTWRVVVETDARWVALRIRPLDEPHGPPPEETARRQSSPWIDRARTLPQVREYEWFAMGRVRTSYRREGGLHVVEFHDMRYGPRLESIDSLWPLRVTFDEAGEVLRVERFSAFRGGGWLAILRDAWDNLWGDGEQ